MPKYTVLVREIHVSHMEIVAESPEGAIGKVLAGEGDEVLCEYSDTHDSSYWTVELNGKEVRGTTA